MIIFAIPFLLIWLQINDNIWSAFKIFISSSNLFYGKNAEMWAETGIPKCDVCAEQQCDFGKPCQVRAVLLVAHNECIWVVYFKERSEKTLNLNC